MDLLAIDQIAAAVGGPTHLGGGLRREPAESFARGDYAILVRKLVAVLDKFRIAGPARGALMAAIADFDSTPGSMRCELKE